MSKRLNFHQKYLFTSCTGSVSIIHKYINKNNNKTRHRYLHGMLRTVQTERICVRVTDEVEIVVIESLHRWQVSTVLLCVRRKRHCWVRDGRAAGRAVPWEVSRRTLLVHGVSRAVALVLRWWVQLAEVVRRFWHRADRAEHRLGDRTGFGL